MRGSPEMLQGPEMLVDVEDRVAPRFTLLIRTAKLIVDDQQFLCVIRDISATGFSIRSFHPLDQGKRIAVEFQSGDRQAADMVWQTDEGAGFQFHTPINVDAVVMGLSDYPRRDLRFDLDLPVVLHTHGIKLQAKMANLSRQGGNIQCASNLLIDQMLRIDALGLPEIDARVRWRKPGIYGLIFDTTFSLAELAQLIRNLHVRQKTGSKIARAFQPTPVNPAC
ncbi:PilZ domain-containing protein [Pontixanthobacter aquaemixtae]|uniref:PilZ domain-containing protein n=1 Tax=Pontixanthobacter aquaemixtae TaxID=1958940 RepID=A0A844ZUH4_9SPHN|nr:PilZ domain-containing protein [Pontixanthobacter aquaemixtae]MXO91535.1 PilZ domain-containing protein [Pontixanthobacter aquaemixtae]